MQVAPAPRGRRDGQAAARRRSLLRSGDSRPVAVPRPDQVPETHAVHHSIGVCSRLPPRLLLRRPLRCPIDQAMKSRISWFDVTEPPRVGTSCARSGRRRSASDPSGGRGGRGSTRVPDVELVRPPAVVARLAQEEEDHPVQVHPPLRHPRGSSAPFGLPTRRPLAPERPEGPLFAPLADPESTSRLSHEGHRSLKPRCVATRP